MDSIVFAMDCKSKSATVGEKSKIFYTK